MRLNTYTWREVTDEPIESQPCRIEGCEAKPRWVVDSWHPVLREDFLDAVCSRHLYSYIDQAATVEGHGRSGDHPLSVGRLHSERDVT